MRDDVLPSGAALRAGWYANYSAYAMWRMEKLWGEDCLEFVPERWLGERGMKRSVWLQVNLRSMPFPIQSSWVCCGIYLNSGLPIPSRSGPSPSMSLVCFSSLLIICGCAGVYICGVYICGVYNRFHCLRFVLVGFAQAVF